MIIKQLVCFFFIQVYEPRSEKTGLNDILEFLCKKHLKTQKNKKFDMFIYCLKIHSGG